MISVTQACQTILSRIRPLPEERVFQGEALGRFLAEDVIAAFDIPLWSNAAMDGYAVHLADCTAVPARLPVTQAIPAGATAHPLAQGQAARIMTGAPIPQGAEAVVMRENTVEHGETVEILRTPRKDENIRFRGEDIKAGDVMLRSGTRLTAGHIGVLASLRRAFVLCRQRPLIAILSTGDELVDLDEVLSPGKIPSSNLATLVSLVRELGAVPLSLGIARDDQSDIEAKLARASRADLILTSGGVSVGDFDLIKTVMQTEANRMEFWQVAMSPGKPLAFGCIGGIPTLGLPGNPSAAMTSFYQFARPAILALAGARDLLLPRIKARLSVPIKKKAGLSHYIRSILTGGEELTVRPSGQGSGILSSMVQANCFIVIPAGKTLAEAGELVDCEVYAPIAPADTAI